MVNLKVLDLFAGLGGATQAFRERDHDVITVDNREDLDPTIRSDIRNLDAGTLRSRHGPFDFVWASPPCQTFIIATLNDYHNENGNPDHPLTHKRLALVHDCLGLVQELNPAAWIIENPQGILRSYDAVAPYERRMITYCQYGAGIRKATDLWGGFPPNLSLRPPCGPKDSCHGGERPEEWKKEKGRDVPPDEELSARRSKVPYELSLEVCEAVEAMVEADLSHEDGKLTAHGVML